MKFKDLITTLATVNEELKEQSLRAVNSSLTLRNWFFGYYIFEFEQNGKDRAEYGNALLSNIAIRISVLNIPNTNQYELARYRQFYLAYPMAGKFIAPLSPILGTVSQKLSNSNIEHSLSQIFGTASQKLNDNEIKRDQVDIRMSMFPELDIPGSHYITLFSRTSYSHLVELIKIEDPVKRLFYELECTRSVWSVRELRRQIGSLLYERTGLSTNKEKLLALTHQSASTKTLPEIIRDPYIFEFIGLNPKDVFTESDLEQALLDHLSHFLLEMGKGFCFEARQRRILIDSKHYFIDLVFYHRQLHCNVLIDLKTERFDYSHAGQLNMYLEYYKKYEMVDGDNPPVGILLCTDKDHEHVEFATAGLDDKIFVSKYLVALPEKKALEEFIKKELKDNNG